jgi:hypothetical protein
MTTPQPAIELKPERGGEERIFYATQWQLMWWQ